MGVSSDVLLLVAADLGAALKRARRRLPESEQSLLMPVVNTLKRIGDRVRPSASQDIQSNLARARSDISDIVPILASICRRDPTVHDKDESEGIHIPELIEDSPGLCADSSQPAVDSALSTKHGPRRKILLDELILVTNATSSKSLVGEWIPVEVLNTTSSIAPVLPLGATPAEPPATTSSNVPVLFLNVLVPRSSSDWGTLEGEVAGAWMPRQTSKRATATASHGAQPHELDDQQHDGEELEKKSERKEKDEVSALKEEFMKLTQSHSQMVEKLAMLNSLPAQVETLIDQVRATSSACIGALNQSQ